MKIIFNDTEKFIALDSYVISKHRADLSGQGICENLSGFRLYEDDEETLIRDCSDFIYKWNIYTERQDSIVLTDLENDRESEAYVGSFKEFLPPLNDVELTECVADLMYEVSLMKLGMCKGV